jgi:hypothetical protein
VFTVVLGIGWAWSAGLQRASTPRASQNLLTGWVLVIILGGLSTEGNLGTKVQVVSVLSRCLGHLDQKFLEGTARAFQPLLS